MHGAEFFPVYLGHISLPFPIVQLIGPVNFFLLLPGQPGGVGAGNARLFVQLGQFTGLFLNLGLALVILVVYLAQFLFNAIGHGLCLDLVILLL